MKDPLGDGDRLRFGVPAHPGCRDRIDDLLLDWDAERPDLEFAPVGVITRLARLRSHLDAALAAVFAQYDLTPADFVVIVALRRVGRPYTLPQARLMEALGLTSGTVSVRLDRLERRGVVERAPDPANARGALVTLTAKGVRLFDEVAPEHLANEDRLLSALDAADRQRLADLLRELLVSFESPTSDAAGHLGLTLEPAHVARARRRSVGLSDRAGLLVASVAAGSPAADAGLERGDLLTEVGGVACISSVRLAAQLARLTGRRRVEIAYLRGDEQRTTRIRLPAGQ